MSSSGSANHAKQPLGDRMLSLCGGDDRPFAANALRAFQALVLTCMAVDTWDAAHQEPGDALFIPHLAAAFILTVSAVMSLSRSLSRTACAAGLAAVAFEWAAVFPLSANHHYLALLCLGLMLLPSRAPAAPATDESVIVLRTLRWVAVIGLAGAGLQKLLFGYWFRGELLAYAVNQSESFAALLGLWIPAEEIERLRAIPRNVGVGPFRVQSWLLIAISNLTWIAEIGLALLLVASRTRQVAVILTLVFIFLIELGAREIFFGGLMSGLVILAWPGNLLGRVLPLFLAFYLYVVATILGWMPLWTFT